MMGKHIVVNLRKFGTSHYLKLCAKVDTCPFWCNKRIEKRLSFEKVSTKFLKLGGQNSNIKYDVAFNCRAAKKV